MGSDEIRNGVCNGGGGGKGKEKYKCKRLMTIPTILTLGRVAAVPLLVSCRLFFVSCVFFFWIYCCFGKERIFNNCTIVDDGWEDGNSISL